MSFIFDKVIYSVKHYIHIVFDWKNYFTLLYNTTGWLLPKRHLYLFKYEIKSFSYNVVYMWHCYLFRFHVMHIYLFQDLFLTGLFKNRIRTKNSSNEFHEKVTWYFEIWINWNYNFSHVNIYIVYRGPIRSNTIISSHTI